MIIGREPQSGPALLSPGVHTLLIAATDPFVSRQHLKLNLQEDGCWATDLNSANGTVIVTTRTEIGQQPVALQPWQVLRLGKSTYLRLIPLPTSGEQDH